MAKTRDALFFLLPNSFGLYRLLCENWANSLDSQYHNLV